MKKNNSDNELINSLKKSFDYWSMIDEESRINCLLVWKKILKNNSAVIKNQTIWIDENNKNVEAQMQQFLESWADAIEEPDFDAAKKSMKKWMEFWEKATAENNKIYVDVLKILEKYWKDMQSKSIE